jgi:hypothetical protein
VLAVDFLSGSEEISEFVVHGNILLFGRYGLMLLGYTMGGFKTGFKRLEKQPKNGLFSVGAQWMSGNQAKVKIFGLF